MIILCPGRRSLLTPRPNEDLVETQRIDRSDFLHCFQTPMNVMKMTKAVFPLRSAFVGALPFQDISLAVSAVVDALLLSAVQAKSEYLFPCR